MPRRHTPCTPGPRRIAAAPGHEGAIGRRVVCFGGVPTAEAYERAVPLIARDNDFELLRSAPIYLAVAEVLDALGLVEGVAARPEINRPGRLFVLTGDASFLPVDVAVANSFDDYASGRDRVLEAALAWEPTGPSDIATKE